MKHSFSALLLTLLFALISVSCEKANEVQNNQAVEVTITFPDFIFTFENQTSNAPASPKAPSITGMSRVSPSEAGMNRISLAVFNSDNTLVFSTTKNAFVDEDFSEPISSSLLPGDYHFVAVIHKTNDASEAAAAIASTSQATITTSKLLSVFAVNQPVTILANQPNTVSIDLGPCITSKFQIKTTDETPANVASCEVILNPSSSATSAYIFNPTTGLAESTYRYRTEFVLSDMGISTFQNIPLGVNCLLSEASQHISVTVNMKDASGNIIKSRTFSDVSMEPNRITRAIGYFFHSAVNSSFTLDTTLDPTYEFEF